MNDTPGPTDEELASRARDGDESAFETLFVRHAPALRAQIRDRLPGLLRRKVAESDVIQMAYLGVHKSLPRFRDQGEGSFRAWLARIVDHKVRDVLRRHVGAARRTVRREVSGPMVAHEDRTPHRGPSPSAVAVGEELRSLILEAMDALPEHYRQVLRLVQEEGLGLAEAGRRLGRTAGATEKLYGRALAKLARWVREGDGTSHGRGEARR